MIHRNITPRHLRALRLPAQTTAARLNVELRRRRIEEELKALRRAHRYVLIGLLICSVSALTVATTIIHLALVAYRMFAP